MTDQFFSTPAALARLDAGPLGPHVDLFASLLSKRGYAKGTIRRQLRAVADLSHWLEEQGLRIDDLDEESLSGFEEQAPRSREVVRKLRVAGGSEETIHLLTHLREYHPLRQPTTGDPPQCGPWRWNPAGRLREDRQCVHSQRLLIPV